MCSHRRVLADSHIAPKSDLEVHESTLAPTMAVQRAFRLEIATEIAKSTHLLLPHLLVALATKIGV